MYGGKIKLVMSDFLAMSLLYVVQLLFVNKDYQKTEWMASHNFKVKEECHVIGSWVIDVC